MKGKITFINSASRLAAAYIGQEQYLVFEYNNSEAFEEGEELENLSEGFAKISCQRMATGAEAAVTVLSSAMSQAKAKLVVAPWQKLDHQNEQMQQAIA